MTRAPGGFISTTLNSSNSANASGGGLSNRTSGGVFTMAEYNGWFRRVGQVAYTSPGTYTFVAPPLSRPLALFASVAVAGALAPRAGATAAVAVDLVT